MSILQRMLILVSVIAIGCGAAEAQKKAEIDAAAEKAKAEAAAREAARPKTATAVLAPTQDSVATGIVAFSRDGEKITVDVEFQGLKPGVHHFYIHEVGDCGDLLAEKAGAPFKTDNGFGEIEPDEKGAAKVEFVSESITLEGDEAIINRSVVIHSGPMQASEETPSKRLACGVIIRH